MPGMTLYGAYAFSLDEDAGDSSSEDERLHERTGLSTITSRSTKGKERAKVKTDKDKDRRTTQNGLDRPSNTNTNQNRPGSNNSVVRIMGHYANADDALAGGSESGNQGDNKPSLRELTRKAYSTASLHSFHSNPLVHHRRKGLNTTTTTARRHPKPNSDPKSHRSSATAPPPGRTHTHTRMDHGVKGQPNMKLRMEAMLEKIKRGVGS